MPLYEFRCLRCGEIFELLVMGSNDHVEMKCPHCESSDFERVMSTAGYSFAGVRNGDNGPKAQTRSCTGGSCTTYDIPGPSR